MPKPNNDIYFLRKEYERNTLYTNKKTKDPIKKFNLWLNEAVNDGVKEPHAMVLSTVNHMGAPSARIVLLREVCSDGFVFYSNYLSKKGSQISENNKVALTFYWEELEKQIRIEGEANKIEPYKSDNYFSTRPFESKISAIISKQSSVIPSQRLLVEMHIKLQKKHTDQTLQRPDYWGGYLVKPTYFEFWQGKPWRLHDRIAYSIFEGGWKIERLAP